MPRTQTALPLVLVTLMSTFADAAAPPPQPNAAAIAAGLRKLGVVGSVLYVAAHPDDENTALLAYLANGARVRTAYLSVTRGDGGQNLIGSEQGPALGLIRTQELLAARRLDGAEQFFTRARDFGYSKSADETLRIWGKEAVLADMVRVIRRFRPDVIVTRFSPVPSDTHGHHTASAMLAVEAFRAAADPKFHPEQLEDGVTPWQARRLYWNRSSWGLKPEDDLSGHVKLDVDAYDPLLGLSYGELAADSRSMHKSQGFGIARSRAPIVEYFKLLADDGERATHRGAGTGILDGLDLGWGRLPGGARVRPLVDKAIHGFNPASPAASIPALAAIDAALDGVGDAGWRARKRQEVQELMLACAGVFAEATAPDFRFAPGTPVEVDVTAVNRSPAAVTLETVRFPLTGDAEKVGKALATPPREGGAATAFEAKRSVHVPMDFPATTPYWLASPPEPGLYRVSDPDLIGAPEGPPPLRVELTFSLAGRRLTVTRPVAYKWTDPVMGERYRAVEIAPAVSVAPETRVLMFPGTAPRRLAVRLTAGAGAAAGTLRLEAPAGWSVEPAGARFALSPQAPEAVLAFQVRPTGAAAAAGTLHAVADVEGRHLSREVVHIAHPHIPIQTYLLDADVRLVPVALATGGKRIGYIPGPGDEVPAALRGVGYDVTMLSDADLDAGAGALRRFDAIVTGVRAFNVSEKLRAAHPTLMAYVEAGGVLVVQYNTNNRLAPLTAPLGPYGFDIGQQRVTDETAAVTFTAPHHPAVTSPNALGPADFEGWVQERGLYFAERWSGQYETPLLMHDPGEAQLAGSLLWARAGQGTFVYTGLAFFRQLPAGVPGAFRLFANLLAGGKAGDKTAHGR
ncbi:MAG TPA: PIG-L family deacetylase [Polyangia bacterium]|nr:PIG-L family deacetylase [Polyangia bacterium]